MNDEPENTPVTYNTNSMMDKSYKRLTNQHLINLRALIEAT